MVTEGRAVWIASVFASSLVLNIFLQYNSSNRRIVQQTSCPADNDTHETETAAPKIVLFWTRWYQREQWPGFETAYGSEVFSSCPVSNCRATNNRSLVDDSDAVLFHVQPGDFKVSDLPARRFPRQRYVMYFFEPLMYSNRGTFNGAPAHFFNWTMTFRTFSDVASSQYGTYEFIRGSMERKISGKVGQEQSLDNFYGVNVTGKSIMVAWFNSHCPTPILRENFAAQLAKFVRVDVYGKCGNFTCGTRDNQHKSDCDLLLANDYLFYLSFENSFCPDYVTEKLYRPLRNGAVPIVLGGVDYSRFAPPHSFINVLDYKSAEQLADYLITLNENRKLYAHYLEWRRHFRVPTQSNSDWCQLCAMLHNQSLPSKSYSNISQWWFDDHPCQHFSIAQYYNATPPSQ